MAGILKSGALGILVAFSGAVDDGGVSYTESQKNGFSESQIPREFEQDEWRFLVVADKYQTGSDQPLLYAMYVDKVLTGLAAVQTLSRLTAEPRARRAPWSSTSATTPMRSGPPSSPTTEKPSSHRPTRTCSTTPATRSTSTAS
jgi:hypothetical protein